MSAVNMSIMLRSFRFRIFVVGCILLNALYLTRYFDLRSLWTLKIVDWSAGNETIGVRLKHEKFWGLV